MSLKTDLPSAPCYVLKNGNQPFYPTISFDNPETKCVSVYGFSDKHIYDGFIKSAGKLLTPYPLVKGYLASRIAEIDSADGVNLGLVILDAIDIAQPVLQAASMAAVLLALQEKAKQVPVEFELAFDPKTASYQFKGAPESMTPIEPVVHR